MQIKCFLHQLTLSPARYLTSDSWQVGVVHPYTNYIGKKISHFLASECSKPVYIFCINKMPIILSEI